MRILLLDVETSPLTVYSWGLWNQNIPIGQIIDSSHVMCFAAKWLEDKEMYSASIRDGPQAMLGMLWELLDKADAVMHYNGTKFDIPVVNKEFLLQGWKPPSPYKQIDLLRVARSQFKFPSNKLDYVAKALGVGGKLKHAGFSLWVDCLQGKKEAWEEMQEYNKNDVVLLEKVYWRLLPWISNHPNHNLYTTKEEVVCPNCESTNIQRRGYAYTLTGKYQRHHCSECGTWFKLSKAELTVKHSKIK